MFDKTVAVVVPAYNEEKQIGNVLKTIPHFVDRIIVINDCSKDNTANVVLSYINEKRAIGKVIRQVSSASNGNEYDRADKMLKEKREQDIQLYARSEIANAYPDTDRIILINHLKNSGVGAAIAQGYKWCLDHNIDCTAVMAGDGQMDPSELEKICTDTQTGYTAISLAALNAIKIHKIYPRYGMPNDLLVKLNIAFCTIKEIKIKPVYNIGETSKMQVPKVIPLIAWLLFKSFFRRLWAKYLFRDFHPLFLLYHFSILVGIMALPYAIKVFILTLSGETVSPTTMLAFFFLFTSSFQSLLFAMWMDIQDNERLYKS
ncbi:MAG: glycosyltransferase family 2 protein [Deltaproteobacteria bacterium HGW-Deltaproteobacteria-1]|nr:MAG: glycosyltransferase family 2 protein [Deltaproteobacteria bacterium HGW-Deltaproteobacteria-1]